jgi:hypothetical protein
MVSRFVTRSLTAAGLAVVLAVGMACGDSTGPTPMPGASSLVFTGTAAPGATPAHQFTLVGSAPLRVQLASLMAGDEPVFAPITLTFGAADGLACRPLSSVSAIASLVSPIRLEVVPGTYCVALADTSALPGDTFYALRVQSGVFPATGPPATIAYSAPLLPGGAATRVFTAHRDGGVIVTMDSITPPGVQVLGVGLGIPEPGTSGQCLLTTRLIVARNRLIGAAVDAGTLCLRVFDPGTLPEPGSFSVRIEHP